jgi:hypothetical protein
MRIALAVSLVSITLTSQAAAQEAPPPPPARADRVMVSVESSNLCHDVVIERRIKTDETYGRTLFLIPQHSEVQTWEQVCVAPCKVEMDRASTYRVGRENFVTPSRHFTLPPGADQVKLDVQPGNFWWHAAATKLIATGTAAAIVGGALITTAHTWDSKSDERHVRNAGIITGAIGLGLLAAGIPIAILTQTHVKANERKVSAAPRPRRLTPGGLIF